MASNFTEHFQLNQWEPGDQVLREDFNEDNRKIDAAIHTLGERIVVGSFHTTTNTAGTTVELGFRPRLMIAASGAYTIIVTGNGVGKILYSANGYAFIQDVPITFTDTGFSCPGNRYPFSDKEQEVFYFLLK